MSAQPNHYETLGLPPTATAEQIKRKYRELARLYHPDVNSSPDAAQRIVSINQAYRVLGEPTRRAVYDAECALRTPPPPSARPSTPTSSAPRPRRPVTHPTDTNRVYYDGFGRAYSQPRHDRRTPPAAGQPRKAQAPQPGIDQILAEAKLAFINREFPLAQRLCHEVIKIDPRNGIAHEILGDVYARQGDSQRAGTAFAYAIQFNPRNQSAQAKLDRLMRAATVPGVGPSITYTRRDFKSSASAPTSGMAIAIVTMVAGGLLVVTPLLLALNSGNPAADGFGEVFGISANLLAALAVGGVSSGLLLAFYGHMRPFNDEAWNRVKDDGTRLPVPLGAILGLLAFLWFYLSFLAYVGIAAMRNRFSPSILRVYATTLGLVFLFTLAYRPIGPAANGMSVPLWSGNILFPTVLFGWLLGDAFRLRGRL